MFEIKTISDIITFLLEWGNNSVILVSTDHDKWNNTYKISTTRIEYWVFSKIKERVAVYDCIDFDTTLFSKIEKYLTVKENIINNGSITYYTLDNSYVRHLKLKQLRLIT